MVNKVDRGILELQVEAENMYHQFLRVVESINVIIATYEAPEEEKSKGASMGDLQVDPSKGSVAFGSGYFGWAFTLTKFARLYKTKFGIKQETMMTRLWGDNYFEKTKEGSFWRTDSTSKEDPKKQLVRAFCSFIMDPIIKLSNAIMNENDKQIKTMLKRIDVELKGPEKEMTGKTLLKRVFQKWINAADALIEMIILRLPSPR